MAIKLFKPFVSDLAIGYVNRVLQSGQLAEGDEVKQFEDDFAKRFSVENVVAVNSGTSALELAYDLVEIGPGDEVISSVLTCTATNLPLARRGAKIVFADIEDDLNISVDDVRRKITDRTKAVVFVHFGGNNRGLRELNRLCRERGIFLIEDAAQAVGSSTFGIGDYTAISLQAIKTLTSGDGGVLLTRNREDYLRARRLRWFGYDRELKQKNGDTDITEAGYKFHMNNISAALGRGNLASLEPVLEHRKKLAEIYKSYGLFAHAWLAGGFTDNYPALKDRAEWHKFEIGQHHYRNDKYTIFKEFKTDCPNMDRLEDKYFFVPYHHGVTEEDAHRIAVLVTSPIPSVFPCRKS